MAGAEAGDDDAEVVAVAKEGRGAHEAVEILRVPDVARMHDDEAIDEVVPCGPLVVARLRRDRARVDPVRNDAQPLGRSALCFEPLPHGLPDRDDPVSASKIRTHEATQNADHRRVAEPIELGRDLREHVLADDQDRRTHALAHDDADVADDRRVRHAEHEIGTRAAQRVPQRGSQVREVVHRSTPELGALERRGGDARDAHVVVLDLPRLVLVSVQHPGDDLDLVVLRERLAELRQEVRGRLDTRPVVLVQDEDALAFAAPATGSG